MKQYKDFRIIGIDHGYGNIKTANTVTPTGITKLDVPPTFTRNTLLLDGSYYLIGEGHKEYLPDKWQDNDNYLFTLMRLYITGGGGRLIEHFGNYRADRVTIIKDIRRSEVRVYSIEESIAPILHELRKIGTNLNQLAYFSNIGHVDRVQAEIGMIRSDNEKIMQQLSDFLQHPEFTVRESR